jgi:four helix bundle protein
LELDATVRVEDYRGLRVWQKAVDLVVLSYELTKRFPPDELYGLTAQIRRAAVSVPANIAEGNGRQHLGDYIQHLSIANGSLKELETHFHVAGRLGYVSQQQLDTVFDLSGDVGRMLTALMQKLRAKRG